MYSGTTNLYDIFVTSAGASDVTRIQPGSNISTGGTGNFPVINLVDSPSINNISFSGTAIGGTVQVGTVTAISLSATSISAGTIYSGSTDVGSMLTAITNAALYSNSTAVPVTIGGISAGATFTAKTMSEMWNALLYPYQTPSFSSFANAGLIATYELGQTIATGSNSFSWAFNNASSVSANTEIGRASCRERVSSPV